MLDLDTHPFRVCVGSKIVGHFSNVRLVMDTLESHPKAIVIDNRVAHKCLYREGRWLQ